MTAMRLSYHTIDASKFDGILAALNEGSAGLDGVAGLRRVVAARVADDQILIGSIWEDREHAETGFPEEGRARMQSAGVQPPSQTPQVLDIFYEFIA